jgi:tripartite-type tricarboxylate transporter receptor subunit TctC
MKRYLTYQFAAAVFGICSVLAFDTASAQAYPSKPLRLVVPWPAGGITDSASRMLAQVLAPRLGQPIVVENRPGANGQIGADNIAKSAPDGYSLFVASAEPLAINPHVYKSLPYEPVRDFVGITPFAINPFSLVSRPDFPAKSVNDIVAAAKQNPGKYSYASWGIGSTSQIGMEMVKKQAGIDVLHVPFTGEAPAVTALMSGQVDLMVLPAGSAARQAGKVKIFAVTVPERFFVLPDTPSLKEEGFANINVFNWFGVVAPAKTPTAIVQRLAEEISATLNSEELKSKYRGMGLDVHPPMSQPDFNRFIASEVQRWGEVIKSANIRLD